jgi:hypothetical protein
MVKKVFFSALLLIMAVLSLHDLAGMAQAVMTSPGKFFPSAQLKKTLDNDKSPQSAVAGQAAIIIPPENFTIRRRVDGPNNASVHTKESDGNNVTEVYYVLEGSATYTAGGSMCRRCKW